MAEGKSPLATFAAVVIVFGLVYYFLKKFLHSGGAYTKRNRIDGKVVIITGCNTGLGKAAAIELAKRGAKLYMACRDMNKCEAARKEVVELSNNPAVFARELDLGSLASVRRFAKRFLEEEDRLDILMNNAGVGMMPKSKTEDGFESHMGINHLGHFLLTNLLLDLLKKSAPSRVVVLSSIAHNFGAIHKDDLMLDRRSYGRYAAYCNSKLANMLFTLHLNRLITGTRVTVNAVNPGETDTDIGRHLPAWLLDTFAPFVRVFFRPIEIGVQTQIMVAIDPDLERDSGKYFAYCKATTPAQKATDYNLAKWLWEKSAELTGMEDEKHSE